MIQNRTKIIFIILAVLFALRLYVNVTLGLAPDEAHYWYWSQHLQLSYFDHPPMVAYMLALSTWIGGNSEFFVRMVGFLIMALSHVLIYLTTRQLTDHPKDFAWEILLVLNLSLLFTAGCIIQTPDTPLTLFWCLGLYSGSRIVTGGSPRWWYLWGVALGLGLLSKYTMILIVPCTMAFCILSAPHRQWFRRKEPYLAGVLALLFFSPVIYWNATHAWVSFAMQLNQGFGPIDEGPVKKLLEYIGGQVGVLTPLLFISFFYYSLYGLVRSLRQKDANHLYLGLLCWPILIFFGISSTRGEVAEANWPALAYVAGLLLASDIFHRFYRQNRVHRYYVHIALGFAFVINILVCIHLVRPFLPLTYKQDNTKQFHGWRELGATLQGHIDNNPCEQGYFLSANYGITTIAPAVFYTGNQYLGLDFFRPEEYTFLNERDVASLQGKNAIILLSHYHPSHLDHYRPLFENLRVLGRNRYDFRGTPYERLELEIVLGEGYKGDWKPAVPPRKKEEAL